MKEDKRVRLKIELADLKAKYQKLKASHDKLKEELRGNAILSDEGLSALESMATVDFMVKACTGALTPTDVAESINGIIIDAKNKADQALAEARKLTGEQQ